MSIYFGVISLILCTFCGYRLSLKFTQRKCFFADFAAFNEKMINEVSFTKKSVLLIAEDERKAERDFGCLVFALVNGENAEMPKYLKGEECTVVAEYVGNLGASDSKSQLSYLSSEKQIIERFLSESAAEETKYKKLYVKLGFLFGLIVFVILL